MTVYRSSSSSSSMLTCKWAWCTSRHTSREALQQHLHDHIRREPRIPDGQLDVWEHADGSLYGFEKGMATLMAHSTFPTTTTTTSSAVPLPSCHPSRPTHEPTASLDLQPRLDDEMMASFIRSPSLGIREDTPRTTSSSTRTGSTNPLPPNQQAQQTRRPASLNLNKTPPSSPMASQIQPPTIDSYNSPSTAGPSQIHTHTEAGFLQPGLFSSPSNLFRPSASSNPPTPSEPSFRQPRSPVRSPNPIGLGIGVLGSKRKFSGGGGQVEIAKKAMKFSFGRSA